MDIMETMRGRLVVSCQAAETSPLHATEHIVALARAAVLGGASGVRIEGVRNVQAVRGAIDLPIIGITKIAQPGSDVYITPSLDDVQGLAAAGADVIAFDATDRPRPVPVVDIVGEIARLKKISMADTSTLAEARQAIAAGADVFITGEISEPQAHYARESGVAYIACGHHASERYGAQAVASHVAAQLGIEHEFIDIDNPA